MDKSRYVIAKLVTAELETLAYNKGKEIYRRAVHLDPERFDKWVSERGSFARIDYEDDPVVFEAWSSGSLDSGGFPVHFLWDPDWEAEVIATREARLEKERLAKEQQAIEDAERKRLAKLASEKKERTEYLRLKRKFEGKAKDV